MQAKLQDEETNETESIAELEPTPYLDEDENASNHLSNLFSSPQGASVANGTCLPRCKLACAHNFYGRNPF